MVRILGVEVPKIVEELVVPALGLAGRPAIEWALEEKRQAEFMARRTAKMMERERRKVPAKAPTLKDSLKRLAAEVKKWKKAAEGKLPSIARALKISRVERFHLVKAVGSYLRTLEIETSVRVGRPIVDHMWWDVAGGQEVTRNMLLAVHTDPQWKMDMVSDADSELSRIKDLKADMKEGIYYLERELERLILTAQLFTSTLSTAEEHGESEEYIRWARARSQAAWDAAKAKSEDLEAKKREEELAQVALERLEKRMAYWQAEYEREVRDITPAAPIVLAPPVIPAAPPPAEIVELGIPPIVLPFK